MKVLYIAKRGPHNIAAQTHLKAIQDIYGVENVYEIDLISSKEVHNEHYISYGYNPKKIAKRVIRFIEGNSTFISNRIIASLCAMISQKDIQLVFTEESDLGNLYRKIKAVFPGVRIICFFHDISADLFKKRIEDAPKWKQHYILECKQIIKQEKITEETVDERWVFNKADYTRFYSYYGYYPDQVIPMGSYVPQICEESNMIIDSDSKKEILFVCSNYYVNISGFTWFYKNVVPRMNEKYHIVVVGSGAQQLSSIVDNPNVDILGRVDSMDEYYKKADIVIEPVFDGGGMKVKTIEALSFGKIIVSTSESLNGYWEALSDKVKNHYVFKCNSAEEWADSMNYLMNTRVAKYNTQVFEEFVACFSYEVLLERFKQAL